MEEVKASGDPGKGLEWLPAPAQAPAAVCLIPVNTPVEAPGTGFEPHSQLCRRPERGRA